MTSGSDTVGSGARAGAWDAALYDRSFQFIPSMAADLVDVLAPQAGERVIDLGCGTGRLTAEIAARGAAVIGIDADPAMVEAARSQYPDIEFRCADGADFSVGEGFDAVFSNAALHWMKTPEPVIASVAGALRPGGRFVAEMGGYRNVEVLTGSLYQALAETGIAADAVDFPWYFPRTADYAGLLEDGGFEIREIKHFERPTPLDDCPNGAADWYTMFGGNFLAPAPKAVRPGIIDRATALAKAELFRDGRWFADYTRLRFNVIRSDR